MSALPVMTAGGARWATVTRGSATGTEEVNTCAYTYVTGLLHECSLWKLSFSFRVGGAGERPRKGEVRRAIVVLWFSGSGAGLRGPHAEAALLAPAGQCRGAGRGQNQQVCHLCLYTSVLDHTMTRSLNPSFIIFLYGLYKA